MTAQENEVTLQGRNKYGLRATAYRLFTGRLSSTSFGGGNIAELNAAGALFLKLCHHRVAL